MSAMVSSGALQSLNVTPVLPAANYAAVYRSDRKSSIVESIANLAQENCDFGTIFQAA